MRRKRLLLFLDFWDHVVCRSSNNRDPLQFKRLVKSIVIDERFIVQGKKMQKIATDIIYNPDAFNNT